MTTGPTPRATDTAMHVDPAAAVSGPTTAEKGSSAPAAGEATTSIGDTAAAVSPPVAAPTRSDPADSSTGDLLRSLTENVRSLVQGEVASARQEMTDKALAARPAAAMLGGAAVLGALATGTSAVVLIRFLDRVLPPTTSAVVATALLGGSAAALAKAGVNQLRLVGPLAPEDTIESVKADIAAVAEATPG
jgi:Putative Actinobacterial Holin-X, holin superfamily III